ncbi:GNAT family N-acetyltransferase [Cohnella yongneupensis]|uniref:GNAT family N-acetyltransferase n=1 Tax=Cohnella yongneupensis TaxID=425006 RepID=A0ABW0QTJ2_9BACL
MIQLKRVQTDDTDFATLIDLLDKDLWARYPDTQQFFHAFNIVKLDANAIVAYENGIPVGCGCYRETEDGHVVEVKRMFVKEEARGKGIAKKIVMELERWAHENGYSRAILETGTNQPEAIALYTKMGYKLIDRYAPYIDSEQSVCMGKELSL